MFSLTDSVVIKNSPVVEINQELKDYVSVKTLDGKQYNVMYIKYLFTHFDTVKQSQLEHF